MAIKEIFIALLVVKLVVCDAADNKCPPTEDIMQCNCLERSGDVVDLTCKGYVYDKTIEEYLPVLQKSLAGKRNIKLFFSKFNNVSSLSSRLFDGLHVMHLHIKDSKVIRWADTEGGPAFVGLEDTLEELELESSLRNNRRKNSYERVPSPAQFTLGHLRKLRDVNYYDSDINTLGNDWFENGPNSLESLVLPKNRIQVLGEHAFANLPNLKSIGLWNNGIEKLTRRMFPNPAKHLEEINIAFNRLAYLPDDLFANMPALTQVEFYENPITHLPETTWRPIWSRLDYLDVSSDKLVCDDKLAWIFEVRPPKDLAGDCYDPKRRRRINLRQLIEENSTIDK